MKIRQSPNNRRLFLFYKNSQSCERENQQCRSVSLHRIKIRMTYRR
nr:MAG TPA: hypothetical protein [Caudoviricetes sp.]